MNEELFGALEMLERERGISADYLMEKVKNAIAIAVKKDYDVADEHVLVVMDPVHKSFKVALLKDVVEEVEIPNEQATLEEARKYDKKCTMGDSVEFPLETKDFGRIAAQTAKNGIRQGIREAERSQMYTEMQSKSHEIVTGVVTRVDNVRGVVSLEIGKSEAVLPRNEQVPGEEYYEGEYVKVYVVDVTVTERGPRVMISRTHPGLVKRLFEMEVPELYDGTVEIKAIAREAGARTKIAVYSKDPNVDPRGACIGNHGARVANIVEELGGEKIDVVLYSEDPAEFIAASLSPASVVDVEILDGETKSCRVTVPDNQLSLAIGNKGQNARLCARLTGYNIDIRPESGYFGEEEVISEDAVEEDAE
ncbi:MAG: transcription termination factor NusA [Oscillospiraceae bacterium]